MSKYTTEVRFICEYEAGCTESQGYDKIEKIVETAAPKIFNNFPIFDEEYRMPLMKKILMHYYTREICEEVVGLWKLRLATRMNEIMPYFNKLYESELLKYEPFYDVDLTTQREMSGQRVGTNKETNESETSGTDERDLSEISTVSDKSKSDKENSNTGVENSNNVLNESNNTSVERNENATNVENSTIDNKSDGTSRTQGEDSSHKVGDGSTTSDSVGTKNSTDTQTHWDLYSDTPQGTIENIAAGASDHNRYLTNARENTDNDTYGDRTTDDTDTTNEYEETVSNERDDTTTTTGNNRTTGSVLRDNNLSTSESNSGERTNEASGSVVKEYSGAEELNSERNVGRNGQTSEVLNKLETTSGKSEKIDTVNNLDSFTERVFGKRGGQTYSKMLMELRDSFINIDEMVINRLGDLFFGLW